MIIHCITPGDVDLRKLIRLPRQIDNLPDRHLHVFYVRLSCETWNRDVNFSKLQPDSYLNHLLNLNRLVDVDGIGGVVA